MNFIKSSRVAGIMAVMVMMITPAGFCGCAAPPVVIVQNDQADLHFKQGVNYASRSDHENAVLEFEQSISIRPTSKAYANMGVSYMKMGKNNKALNALKAAVGIDSCDAFAQYNLAALYSVMDQTDLGIDALDRALQCGFNNYDAIRFDADLNNLRGVPEFRKMLEKHKVFLQ